MYFYDEFDADTTNYAVDTLTWDDDENAHDGKCICPRCIALEMDY